MKRRKNFNPRKWASKWLKDSGGLPTIVYVPDPNDHDWPEQVVCCKCGTSKSKIEGVNYPSDWKCTWCDWSIPSKGILVDAVSSLQIAAVYFYNDKPVKIKAISFDHQTVDVLFPDGIVKENVPVESIQKIVNYKEYNNTWIEKVIRWFRCVIQKELRKY